MLALHSITKRYNGTTVLKDVSLSLKPGVVMGLIGANGAGKSTLLQIAAGVVRPDTGTVTAEGERVGYLPQQLGQGERRVDEYLRAWLAWPDETFRLELALAEVGLESELSTRRLGQLSGGQRTRVGLAGLLLAEPTVLLLDEPTNNLDSASAAWLASFIQRFNGALLMASHDRQLLDVVATDLVELADGQVAHYGGNYQFYQEQKAIERSAQAVSYRTYRAEQKRLKQAIAQKQMMAAKVAKAGAPDNEKGVTHHLQDKVSRLYHKDAKTMTQRLERLPQVDRPAPERRYTVTIAGEGAAQKLMVAFQDVAVSYPGRPVIKYPSFELRGRERLAVLGANGSGKTTLLKLAAGQLPPSAGRVALGQAVAVGYYAQTRLGALAGTGLDYLQAAGVSVQACYDMARSLRLSAADLRRPAEQLSYGGLAKLAFARLLLQPLDLLILDEPTNHLEISVRHDIEIGLQQYGGALMVASHDQYFLDALQPTKTLRLAT